MNIKQSISFSNKSTLCSKCNVKIPINEFFKHQDKCSSFKSFKQLHHQTIDRDFSRLTNFVNNKFMNTSNSFWNNNTKSNSNLNTIGSGSRKMEDIYDDINFQLNDATLTFGAKNGKKTINLFNDTDKSSNDKLINKYKKSNHNSVINTYNSHRDEENTNTSNELHNFNKMKHTGVSSSFGSEIGIINKLGDHNSFMSVIIQAFYSIQNLRNFLLNEMVIHETDFKNCFLLNLQKVIEKIHSFSQNKLFNSTQSDNSISITELRKSISDIFQSRRKFLLEYPDDPIDLFYALINSLHSFHLQSNLNELNDNSCNMKCFSHKYMFMDIYRIDECKCGAKSKKPNSFHNYVIDLPLDKILKLAAEVTTVANSYSAKLISDMRGQLFYYYKNLLKEIDSNINCPEKGIQCVLNKNSRSFYLSNTPTYMSFSLQLNINSQICLMDVLKIFVMIPNIFESASVYTIEENESTSNEYELIGCICISASKNYTAFFVSEDSITHYDDETVTKFNSYKEVISKCLKSHEQPVLVFYQLIKSKIKGPTRRENKLFELNIEDITKFERYCRNTDNLYFTIQNKFRPFDDFTLNYADDYDSYNKFRRNINLNRIGDKEKENRSNSTNCNSRQTSNNYYECFFCGNRNKIEDRNNVKCNDKSVDDIKKKSMPEENFLEKENSNSQIIHKLQNDHDCTSSKDKVIIGKDNISHINLNKFPETPSSIKIEPTPSNISRKLNDHKIKLDKKDYNLPKQLKEKGTGKIINSPSSVSKINNYESKTKENSKIKKLDELKDSISMNKSKKLEHNSSEKSINLPLSIINTEVIQEKPNFNAALNSVNTAHIVNDGNTVKTVNTVNTQCICFKFENEKLHTIFNDNICRICGRNRIEKINKDKVKNCNIFIRSTENINTTQSTVGKSSIITDLNKRLSALKNNEDKNSNNYFSGIKNVGIKIENVKFISDKSEKNGKLQFNGNDNKNHRSLNLTNNLENKKNITNNNYTSIKRDLRIENEMKTNLNNLTHKDITSPNRYKSSYGINNSKISDIYSRYHK